MLISRRFMQTVADCLAKSDDPGHRAVVQAMEQTAERFPEDVESKPEGGDSE